jgi:hypothetical protein
VGVRRSLFIGFLGFGLLIAVCSSVAADDFTVASTPYRVNHTLASQSLWNAYELNARDTQRITYTMSITTPGACASLYFLKGHNPGPLSQYFVTFSEQTCVQTYSNSFPVEAADGTEFSVLIETDYIGDVSYSLVIDLLTPAVPSWLLGIGILAIIGLAPIALYILWQRATVPPIPRPSVTGSPPPTAPPTSTEPVQPPSVSQGETGI